MPCDYWATAFNNPISLARYFPVPLMLAAFLFGLPSTNGITNTRIGASSFVYSWTKIRERFFLQKRNLPSRKDVLELPHSTRASFGETMANGFPADKRIRRLLILPSSIRLSASYPLVTNATCLPAKTFSNNSRSVAFPRMINPHFALSVLISV